MSTYASVGDVAARNPYRAVTGATSPDDDQVLEWLDETEARLDAALASVGITLHSSRYSVVRPYVVDNVVGLVREAYAAAGGDGANKDGAAHRERFDNFLLEVISNPARWALALGASSTSSSRSRLRSYQTDNADGLTIEDGDFDPVFRKGDEL